MSFKLHTLRTLGAVAALSLIASVSLAEQAKPDP